MGERDVESACGTMPEGACRSWSEEGRAAVGGEDEDAVRGREEGVRAALGGGADGETDEARERGRGGRTSREHGIKDERALARLEAIRESMCDNWPADAARGRGRGRRR